MFAELLHLDQDKQAAMIDALLAESAWAKADPARQDWLRGLQGTLVT